MGSLFGDIYYNLQDSPADQVIAYNAAEKAAAVAQVYLSAAMTAATPELRRLFMGYYEQALRGQEVLLDLMLRRNWIKPYATPEQQLASTFSLSQNIISSLSNLELAGYQTPT